MFGENKRTSVLWLALPLLPLALSIYLLGRDASVFLLWWFGFSLIGLIAWPITARLTPVGDYGYLLAKPLGLLMSSFPLWLLAHLNVIPLKRWSILLMLLILALVSWLPGKSRSSLYQNILKTPTIWRRIGAAELLFTGALLFWTFARGLKPELDSLEKFMNIGFMNSLWRSDRLPAADMWFAGSQINYYYYGQYVFTFLARLTNIRPEIAYNLSLASTFALSLSGAYTFASHALHLAKQHRHTLHRAIPAAGGLTAALLLTLAGNSHAFFYQESGLGYGFQNWLRQRGLIQSNPEKIFWFADSTRFIGYNPGTADKTIHEFPFYSFLVADLHAHVINLTFVLLLLTILIHLISQEKWLKPSAGPGDNLSLDNHQWHKQALLAVHSRVLLTIRQPHLLLIGVLLALFMMCNYWDFAIYAAVTALVLLYLNSKKSGRICSKVGLLVLLVQAGLVFAIFLLVENPRLAVLSYFAAFILSSYLTITSSEGVTWAGAQVSWLFFFSHLLALPFNQSFEPIAKTIALTVNRTPLWQLAILWGAHVLSALIILFTALIISRQRLSPKRLPQTDQEKYAAALPGNFLERAISLHSPIEGLVLICLVCGIGLILVPEIVYVVDIYSGEFKRANTMFKFTYQAFTLLSLAWAYSLAVSIDRFRQTWRQNTKSKNSWLNLLVTVSLCLLLILPFSYTRVAASQWLGAFRTERYLGLDGLAPLAEKQSDQISEPYDPSLAADYAAINWLNQYVKGQPVILEAFGESYTDYCRISAFTGLPTVFGWETHQWLWRTSRDTPNAYSQVVLPRQEDVRILYTTSDQIERVRLINHYAIRYIIVGNLERSRFSETDETGNVNLLIQEQLLQDLGTVVFNNQDLYIIEIDLVS